MKILKKIKFIPILLLIAVMQFVFIPIPEAHAYTAYSNPATVPLGTVSNFAALAASTITAAAATVLNNGDLGTNLDCTDFAAPCDAPHAFGTINNGAIHRADDTATTGQTDATAAVTNIGLRSLSEPALIAQLGSRTLGQGVYEVPAASTNLTGTLTLDGDANSVFIFHLTSTLVTDNGSKVLLTGGAQACHVFWKVDSSATFNGTTQMVGTVLAQAAISFVGVGGTLDGRAIAQTEAVTFGGTTVNNSSCAAASSSSSSSSFSIAGAPPGISCPAFSCVTPIILESRRVSPTSIFLSWGPYAGMNQFSVQYGVENGKWLYNTNVTGFSTTLNGLPPNQSIWVLIQPRDNCSIGPCGVAKLVGDRGGVGGPRLPNTGFGSEENNFPWYILVGSLAGISVFLGLIQRKYRFLSTH